RATGPNGAFTQSGRKPALGGALGPTREDAKTAYDATFEYSQRLSQQVLSLEADNVELQDAKRALLAENAALQAKVRELQDKCDKVQATAIFTHQDKEAAILQAREALQSRQAEVMLARKSEEDLKRQAEALASDNLRLNGIAEKLQTERSQLQRTVLGLEASIEAFQEELRLRAEREGQSMGERGALERRLEGACLQNARLARLGELHHADLAELQRSSAELLQQRQRTAQATEELQASRRDVAWLRAKLAELDGSAGHWRSEAERWRHASGAAAAQAPRLEEAVHRESALADSLRGRIAELEEHLAKVLKVQVSAEAECAGLRSQLASSRGEAEHLAKTASRLAGERSHAEQQAQLAATAKMEADRRCHVLELEHLPELVAKQQANTSDLASLRSRLAQLEGENTILKGQVSQSEVLVKGLRTELADVCASLGRQPAGVWRPCSDVRSAWTERSFASAPSRSLHGFQPTSAVPMPLSNQ
ncbi:unnamed protein product, partial [Effrenium voratum]